MDKAIGMTLGEEILEAMLEHNKIRISEDRIIEVDIEETIEMIITKEVGVGLETGHIQVISEEMAGVVVIVGQSHNQEQVRIETELCVKCREYDHFVKDCPTMAREERETEQIQQMFNLDEEQTALNT